MCVWFIHEAFIKERELLYQACKLLFFGLSQEIWKSLNQIKPDFILGLVDYMPKKWFAFCDLALERLQNKEKRIRLNAVEHFLMLACNAKTVWNFLCYCGDLSLIYDIARLIRGSFLIFFVNTW